MAQFKYIGDGDWIPGIPAKDIDADSLSKEQLAIVKDSSLYQEQKAKSSKPKKEAIDERSN